MNNDTDELTNEERRALSAWHAETKPPAFLEDRIVAGLKEANVIRARGSGWLPAYPGMVGAFVLGLTLFIAGFGLRWILTPATQTESPGFLLVVHQPRPEFESRTPTEELQRVREFGVWARDLQGRGLLLGGEKLKDEGRFFGQSSDNGIVETPSNFAAGSIAGYFLLPASDYNQAVAIARTCPNLKHGGSVELRQIERF